MTRPPLISTDISGSLRSKTSSRPAAQAGRDRVYVCLLPACGDGHLDRLVVVADDVVASAWFAAGCVSHLDVVKMLSSSIAVPTDGLAILKTFRSDSW